MRQVIFAVTHADPQTFVELAGLPDLPATTLTDLYRGTAYVDRNGIQLRMVFRATTSVRIQRETNHDLPQRTYMYIQPFSTSVWIGVDWRWVPGLLFCYTVSIPFIWNRLVNLLERKDMKQTVVHKRWTSDCKHQVSEHLQRRRHNDLLSMVVSVNHLLP